MVYQHSTYTHLFSSKTMSRSTLLTLFLWLLCIGLTNAQEIVVDTKLDSTAILIGQQVRMTTRVACKKGDRVIFPEYKNGYVTQGLEMLQASNIDTAETDDGKRWELTRKYTLTAFDSAVYVIPKTEIEVNGRKYLSKNEIGLKVNTVKVDLNHPDEFRPLKAPVETVFVWRPRLLLQSLAIWLLMALFVFCVIQSKTAKPRIRRIKIVPPPPPQAVALEAIGQLKAMEREGTAWQKEYFMALTDVLRTYINNRFHFSSKEMTTGEIIGRLNASGDAQALGELREILETADLVKFAKYPASLAESDRALLQAADYIRTTQEEVNEDQQPKERVIVENAGLQRRKRFFKVSAIISFVFSLALLCYTGYELWMYLL